MSFDIIQKLKKEIENFSDEIKIEPTGEVIEASDGVVKIIGLTQAMSQEKLIIETSSGDISAVPFN